MPPIDMYRDPNSLARNTINTTFAGDMRKRSEWFDQVRTYYNGDHPASLDVKDGEINDNAVINMVKQALDRTVGFLFPDMPKLEVDPNVSEETEDEQWLREMWEANGGIAFLHETAYIGGFSGHNYVRVVPPDPAQGDIYPRLIAIDPKSVQTWWKNDDLRRVVFHEVRWTVVGDTTTEDYILDFVNLGKSWRIIQYRSGNGANVWEEISREEWKIPLPPIIDWKHLPNVRSYYGAGEFDTSLLMLNRQINNVVSETNRIIRYHASPKTVAVGTKAGDVKTTAIDELWAVENPEAEIFNLEMKSDLTASNDHLRFLIKSFLGTSRVVILEGTVKDFQRVTNAGVRTVFIDMLSKLIILRWNYGQAIREISRVAAAVGKRGFDVAPTVVYSDPLPTDQTEAVNVLMLERSMQLVSRETASTKRGYMWPEEKSKMEAESKMELFKPPEPTAGPNKQPGAKPGLQNEPGSTSNK